MMIIPTLNRLMLGVPVSERSIPKIRCLTCGKRTKGDKAYCTDHLNELPYIRKLQIKMEENAETL